MKKKIWILMLVCVLLVGLFACSKDDNGDGGNGGNGTTGAETVLSGWMSDIYGSNRNMTIEVYQEIDGDSTLVDVYKHDGREGSRHNYSEELGDSVNYYVVEGEQLYSYYKPVTAERYTRQVKSTELTIWFFGDEQPFSYAWFTVSGQTCTLKPEHFEDLFGASHTLYSGFDITISETTLTLTYHRAGETTEKVIVVFKDVGTTTIVFPDFGDYISW